MIQVTSLERIEDLILPVRDQHVMLDADLAVLYGVTTKHLNEQVKRNAERFPDDFMFRLTGEEVSRLEHAPGAKGQFRGHRHRPYAFTAPGAGMLASVLRGPIAGRVAVEILRAFKRLRPDDELPGPADDVARVVGSLFSAIRDAALLLPEDTEFTTDEPYTYFIRAGEDGPIKIGWTRNLLVRLRTLSAMWPVPLKLLGVIRGNVEARCHARLAAFRLGGEWFMPSPAVLDFIRSNATLPDTGHGPDGSAS